MKYPIGIQDFEKLRTNGYSYVDKSRFVYKLATEGEYYFLSRPRRFGKSLFLSTLEAYFQGKKELFEGLATLALRFKGVIARAAEKEGCGVVILIDEYDKPILQTLHDPELQAEHRAQLKAFYSVLKTQDRYIKFAFLTGVTKFGKVSVFSDLNNLTDISMDHRYISICGMTEKELLANFKEGINELASANEDNETETIDKLRMRYSGYHFEENSEEIYNPFSVLNTLANSRYDDYWFKANTHTFLIDILKKHDYCITDLNKAQVKVNMMNNVDFNPIPVIYQSGYLTIKSYDERFKNYQLGIPNKEVEEGILNTLLPHGCKTAEMDC